MISSEIVIGLIGACGSSLIATAAMLWGMRRWNRLVSPSSRGMHTVPKPAGGGIGVIAGFAVGHVAMGVPLSIYWWSAMGILLFAVIDDVGRPFSVLQKTILMLISIVCLLLDPQWLALFAEPIAYFESDIALFCFGVFWFFSLCNVFNFMDGIDGIGATQSIIIASFLSLHVLMFDSILASQLWIFVASLIGFLVFNKPPAKIFMGDVGSLFCGFFIAAFSIYSVASGVPILHVLVLLSYYFADTAYTLVRRFLNRENIFQAHNKHVYQRLVRMGWSHSMVSIWAGIMTILNGMGGYLITSGVPGLGWVCWFISAIIWSFSILYVERKGPSFA